MLRDVWMEGAVFASLTSLVMFAVIWNALTLDSMTYVFGPIVSFIVLVAVSLLYWRAHEQVSGSEIMGIKEVQ